MIYGHNRTIHKTQELNVEVDKDGKVVAVWFRCMPLPFNQSLAEESRAEDMRRMYEEGMPALVAVEVEDK